MALLDKNLAADANDATVYAKEISPLDQPNSSDKGFKNTEMEASDPNARALSTKEANTITHPYAGSFI